MEWNICTESHLFSVYLSFGMKTILSLLRYTLCINLILCRVTPTVIKPESLKGILCNLQITALLFKSMFLLIISEYDINICFSHPSRKITSTGHWWRYFESSFTKFVVEKRISSEVKHEVSPSNTKTDIHFPKCAGKMPKKHFCYIIEITCPSPIRISDRWTLKHNRILKSTQDEDNSIWLTKTKPSCSPTEDYTDLTSLTFFPGEDVMMLKDNLDN